jgi:hypothetical protein
MQWDPKFAGRSPLFEPYARCASRMAGCAEWPAAHALDALLEANATRNARGLRVRAMAAEQSAGALSYEARVYERGELAVREREWHDLLNVLAWCVFPRTKAALNARHVAAARSERTAHNRGRTRDALTLLDESGAIVVSSEPDLIEHLRRFRWKRLFVDERERVRERLRVFIVGHGLLEKALDPYVGLTAHALPIVVDTGLFGLDVGAQAACVDALAAKHVAEELENPDDLAPLPVLGMPGSWAPNENPEFYDDAAYFRPGRRRSLREP